MISTQTAMDSIKTQCGGPDTIYMYLYFEGLTWCIALFNNWVQPFSYFDIWETCLFDV
jgi:hypothetical protein